MDATNMTTTTTAPAGGGGADDLANGVCSDNNLYLVLKSIGCVVLLVLWGTMCFMVKYRPPPLGPDPLKWQPYYGRPYKLGVIAYGMSFWNLLPNVLLFVIFHVLFPNMFPMVSELACSQMIGPPVLPLVVGIQGSILLFIYNASKLAPLLHPHLNSNTVGFAPSSSSLTSSSKTVVSGIAVTAVAKSTTNTHKRRVLMIGAPSCGALFASAIKDELDGVLQNVETFIFDFSNDEEFLIHNALVATLGVPGYTAADIACRVLPSTGILTKERLCIPSPAASFDKVVLCPDLRSTMPIGSLLHLEATKGGRMRFLLAEAARVLRPGGEIVSMDTAMATLLISSDLRDISGGNGGDISDPSVKFGHLPLLKSRYLLFRWKAGCFKEEYDGDSGSAVVLCSNNTIQKDSPLLPFTTTHHHDHQCGDTSSSAYLTHIANESVAIKVPDVYCPSETGFLAVGSPGDDLTLPPMSYMARACIVFPYQFAIATVLMFMAAALYGPLNVPTNVVLNLRVNSYVPSAALTYPMVTYFIRASLFDYDSVKVPRHLVELILKTDLVAFMFSFGVPLIMWLPQFIIQLALSPSGLSEGVKTSLGIGISVAAGLGMFKFSHWKSIQVTTRMRKFTPEQIELLHK